MQTQMSQGRSHLVPTNYRILATLGYYFRLCLGVVIAVTAMASASAAAEPKPVVKRIIIQEANKSTHVSPSLALAVAYVESRFQSDALSPKGAIGVMQIMPRTGRTVFGLTSQQLYDSKTNIRAGIKFLDQLIKQYDGRIDLALSHYNGGSAVSKNGKRQIIPYTKNYVLKVLAAATSYADAGEPSRGLAQVPAYVQTHISRRTPVPNTSFTDNIDDVDFWLDTAKTTRREPISLNIISSPSARIIKQMENNRRNFRNRLRPQQLSRYGETTDRVCRLREDSQARVQWECI